MEHKKFIQQLHEFAELKKIKVPRSPNVRETDEDEFIWRNGQELIIDKDDNQTLGIAVNKLKNMVRACEDCGDIVNNRVVHYKVCEYPEPHWRASCKNCSKTKNPITNQFDLDCVQANNVFRNLIKEKKPVSVVKFCRPTK